MITRTPLPGAWPWGGDASSAGEHGLIAVTPNDPDALAQAVQSLVDAPDRLAGLGQRAREAYERYAAPEVVTRSVQGVLDFDRGGA